MSLWPTIAYSVAPRNTSAMAERLPDSPSTPSVAFVELIVTQISSEPSLMKSHGATWIGVFTNGSHTSDGANLQTAVAAITEITRSHAPSAYSLQPPRVESSSRP